MPRKRVRELVRERENDREIEKRFLPPSIKNLILFKKKLLSKVCKFRCLLNFILHNERFFRFSIHKKECFYDSTISVIIVPLVSIIFLNYTLCENHGKDAKVSSIQLNLKRCIFTPEERNRQMQYTFIMKYHLFSAKKNARRKHAKKTLILTYT